MLNDPIEAGLAGGGVEPTADARYAQRLDRLSAPAWKRTLNVQLPYQWNLRRLRPGRVLDIGCGIGRNLRSVDKASVGVDHNSTSIEIARSRGLAAYTPAEFFALGERNASFDSLLLAHVLEHLPERDAEALMRNYLPFLKSGGKVIMITPQEAGFRTDPTHVRFVDFSGLKDYATGLDLRVERAFSFPFPRWVGRYFPYNEFVCVATWQPKR
jgi:SAM-dependent methyltransferase